MRCVGLCPVNQIHFLDHLIPLCELLELPLFVVHPYLKILAEALYPNVSVECIEPKCRTLDEALEGVDAFIAVQLHRVHEQLCRFGTCDEGDLLLKGKQRSCCSIHGNTDKCQNRYFLEQFVNEQGVMIYGQQMIDMLESKGIYARLSHPIVIGNMRKRYYEAHRAFFDQQLPERLKGSSKQKRVLYAPTWAVDNPKRGERGDYSSFFSVHEQLFSSLPDEILLLFKPHPNLQLLYPEEMDQIRERWSETIVFIEETPLVYPYLAMSDVYLGDASSIGYDFLTFNRPLFFLAGDERPKRGLWECGVTFEEKELPTLFQRILDSEDHFDEKRLAYNAYTWADVDPLTLKGQIEEVLQCT